MNKQSEVGKSEIPNPNSEIVKILLIEDDSVDALLLRKTLAKVTSVRFGLTHVEQLGEALKLLSEESFDVILLDLSLPDSWGLDTFTQVHAQAPDMPIVVLTGLDDEAVAVEAVQKGAQDYLVKGQADSNFLVRAIRYAIERQRMQTALRNLSLIDDLTGLCNRRGFLTLTEQHLKLAYRTKRGLLLVFADLDGLKQINDTLGHQEGNIALKKTAEVFKETFRKSDIIARIGGDEFAVIAIETRKDDAEIITTRLQKNLEAHNAKENYPYKLSISIGTAYYDPEYPCSIDEMLTRADTLMYEQKRSRMKGVKSDE